jgi:hypothetical protein
VTRPALLNDTPGGSPVAVKEGTYPAALSDAATWRYAGLPMAVSWAAGGVSVTVPGPSHRKLTDPVAPVVGLVAVTTTLFAPAPVMVPVIWPVPLIDSPAGRPDAVKRSACPVFSERIWRETAAPAAVRCVPGSMRSTA